jgi:hypothetical protein
MASESLECFVGNTRLAILVARVERLVEYELGPPPPLAHPWVAGIGWLGDRAFVSVALDGRRSVSSSPTEDANGPVLIGAHAPALSEANVSSRSVAKGLLMAAPEGGLAWALEVDSIGGMALFERKPQVTVRLPSWPCPVEWLSAAETADGRDAILLDTAAVDAHMLRPADPPAAG